MALIRKTLQDCQMGLPLICSSELALLMVASYGVLTVERTLMLPVWSTSSTNPGILERHSFGYLHREYWVKGHRVQGQTKDCVTHVTRTDKELCN